MMRQAAPLGVTPITLFQAVNESEEMQHWE